MIQLDAPNVLASYSYLGAAIKHLELGRAELLASGDGVCHMGPDQLGDIIKCSFVIKDAAERLELPAAKAAALRFYGFLMERVAEKVGTMNTDDMGRLTALGGQMLVVFGDELEGHLMFVMPSKHARFYSTVAPFGEAINEAFPSISYDVEEAAKCRALGRWTACVMHVMRVLEVGLGALAKHLGAEADGNWNTVLNQIEVKAREIGKRTHGKAAEQWTAEAGTHLRFIKNAWRNHAMHPLEKYDEERAIAIFENARSFMQHLAERLTE